MVVYSVEDKECGECQTKCGQLYGKLSVTKLFKSQP